MVLGSLKMAESTFNFAQIKLNTFLTQFYYTDTYNLKKYFSQ